jgi:hypothetical protein
MRCLALAGGLLAVQLAFAQTGIRIETPMSPPEWALLQRAVLAENSRAIEAFAEKYVDSRGYLLHTPRWGTLDGPDDAIETYFNWTLLHALGARTCHGKPPPLQKKLMLMEIAPDDAGWVR